MSPRTRSHSYEQAAEDQQAPRRDFEPVGTSGLERYAGRYVDLNHYSHASIERLRSLVHQVLVEANPDGSLTLFGGKLRPVEPDLFQWLESGNFVAFRSQPDGEVTHLFVNRTAFARMPWYETLEVQVGLLGFGALALLLAMRMPVATAMMTVGFVGIYAINPRGALATLAGESFSIATVYSLTILPLFILMGNFAGISGMSRDLYDAAHAWVGHWRGGLASATIVGCAGFSALSGSSLASAVTMGRVALPEMRRYRYDNKLATGAVAAGGTPGILIPPSAGFVIYALLTA